MPSSFVRAYRDAIGVCESGCLLGYKTRDCLNAAMSDACVAFLTTLPKTGKGTMQTVNLFVNGSYDFVVLQKPKDQDWKVLSPTRGGRPVIVFWNLCEEAINGFTIPLRCFMDKYQPRRLMFSG